MHDWMDFNRDGEVDWSEKVLAAEMLCTSREEHNALFGDDGDFDDDAETDDADFEYDAIMSGLDPDELMDRMRMKEMKCWKTPVQIRMITIFEK